MSRDSFLRLRSVAALLFVLLLAACAKREASAPSPGAAPVSLAEESTVQRAMAPAEGQPAPGQPPAMAKAAPAQRKIIRNADLEVVVKAYEPAATALAELARKAGGFVAESNVRHEYQRISHATWVLRLPAAGLDDALQTVRRLGVVTAEKITAEDVTEQHVDLKARLDNAKAAEKRLIELLQQKTAELKDVLEVERELTRVRETIEVFEGKLRLLEDRVDLSTLTVRLRVEEKYVPPMEPTLGDRLAETWHDSIDALVGFGELLLVVVVAVAPWLVVLAALGVVAFVTLRAMLGWFLRRLGRKDGQPKV